MSFTHKIVGKILGDNISKNAMVIDMNGPTPPPVATMTTQGYLTRRPVVSSRRERIEARNIATRNRPVPSVNGSGMYHR
jgi:hypothetical protein